jgi:hypothetical protein
MTTTLTRADTESILIARVGGLMTACGLDGTTVDGTNTDLNDPIRYGITQADGSVDDFTLVDDDDIATVATDDYDKMLDLAEYRILQNCLTNLALTDIEVGPRKVWYDQLSKRLEKSISNKKTFIDDLYDFAVPELATFVLDLNFAEHDEDNVDEEGR